MHSQAYPIKYLYYHFILKATPPLQRTTVLLTVHISIKYFSNYKKYLNLSFAFETAYNYRRRTLVKIVFNPQLLRRLTYCLIVLGFQQLFLQDFSSHTHCKLSSGVFFLKGHYCRPGFLNRFIQIKNVSKWNRNNTFLLLCFNL